MTTSSVSLQSMVQELWDREAIRDCLARYCRGVDRFDRALILSAFHPDAIDEHGKFIGNPEEFVEWALDQHSKAHLSHQHYMLNHRCDIEGDTAHAETYFMFVSMNREGKPLTMGGGRYVDRFEKRNGVWAIAFRVCLRDWAMLEERPDLNDLSSFTSTRGLLSDEMRAFMNGGPAAKRDRSDPSYQRPLRGDPERIRAYRRMTQARAEAQQKEVNTVPVATMRAVAFGEFGGPDVLHVMELPLPQAGAGEVVVRVVASTVNPSDLMMRSGQQAALMTGLTPPYIAGMEFAGYVHRIGGGSAGLMIGQSVMGVVNPRFPDGGSHAQYLCVPATSLAPLDRAVDLAEAATVPMNGLTAKMVIDALELRPGDTVLVTGAAGAVGGYVIQLAKHAGLTVIADAKDADADLVRRLGADEIVPRGDAMDAAVRRRCPNGVDGLVDGALIGDRAAALVRDGGTAVSLRKSNPITDTRLRARYVSVIDQMSNTAALVWLGELVRDGILTPRIGRRLPMTEAAQAHLLVEQGGLRGRVVLMFDDPASH